MTHLFQRRAAVAAGVAALLIGALACDMPGGAAPTATTAADTLPPAPTEASEAPTESVATCEPPLPNASIVREEKWDIYCDDAHGFGFRYPAGAAPGTAPGDVNIFLPIIAGT